MAEKIICEGGTVIGGTTCVPYEIAIPAGLIIIIIAILVLVWPSNKKGGR